MLSQTPKIWSEKILAARRRREQTLPLRTNAFRLVDGDGDNLGGLTIDAFAGRWLVQTRQTRPGLPLPPFPPEFGFQSLYHKLLSPDQRRAPVHLAGEPLAGPFLVEENGCKFWIDFHAVHSQGLFIDQR